MGKTKVLDLGHFRQSTNSTEFYINTISDHLVTSHREISLPHKHNFYLAMLFTKGTGTHEIDFTAYDVKPGSLFFLNPGQTHHWNLSPDADGYIFFHTQEFYDLHYTHNRLDQFPFYYSIYNLPCLYPDNESLELLTKWFALAFAEKESAYPLMRHKLASLIDLIYIESTQGYIRQNITIENNQNTYSPKFRRFEELVGLHYASQKSPSAYAKMLNMSAKHLNRITQQAIGKTASDIITERVLLEAKRELILQKQSFTQIARALGYEDYAYFSRLFKKKTCETPSVFIARYNKV